ncbi:hypothetical protein MSAN_02349100 [Mycena sanguinolenta]|uniref:Uncharacterized protein n=1 Tax=Mycena sanguinolenta TaxID=230812 RepID=A0A8H6X601_9AGAR|nr:hypothetical protein MSAN_02349100 [Mycena sanguinolenta]
MAGPKHNPFSGIPPGQKPSPLLGIPPGIDWSQEFFLYCAAVEWFLYGIYLVLFGFCVKTLRHSRVRHRFALSVAITVIFVLCTSHWILQLVNAGELLTILEVIAQVRTANTQKLVNEGNRVNVSMGAIYVTSNLIADGIFIYRCYCMWGYRKRIIAVPIVLLIASGCSGYASVIACGLDGLSQFISITRIFALAVVFSVLTNVMLMGLTAGRVWWIARGARMIMGPAVVKQYRTVIAMILESGALYVAPSIIYLILVAVRPVPSQVIFAMLAQIVGIAPTIIVVRVGMGNSVDSVDSFREGGSVQGSVLDIRPDIKGLDLLNGKRDPDFV